MRSLVLLGSMPLLIATLACSTLDTRRSVTGDAGIRQAPGALFYSMEAAALAAMTHAHSLRFPTGRPQILAGTILRVPGGFSYTPAAGSARKAPHAAPTLRHRLEPAAVASYLVYTRLGATRADRAMERPRAVARRIVDEVDAQHRPVFLLTPSLEIVTYDGEGFRFFARLGDRSPIVTASDQ